MEKREWTKINSVASVVHSSKMKLASNYQLKRFFQLLKISLCNLFSKEKNLTLSHFQTLKWEPQSPGSLKDSETVTMWNRLVILARARSRTALVKPISTAFMTIKRNSVHLLFVSIWGRASATKHFARLTYQESAKSTTWSWGPGKKGGDTKSRGHTIEYYMRTC